MLYYIKIAKCYCKNVSWFVNIIMDMYKRFKNPEGTFKERYPKITCLRNFNNLLPWKNSSEQAGTFLSSSPSLSKDYCIHSFWSQNTEKRNTTISQMRLRSVFKMRISILNTATTEQMGYGSISFFVYFL